MYSKCFLLLSIFSVWFTSNGVNSYKTYNNRYTVASASLSGASSVVSDDDHPNDIIAIRDTTDSEIPMQALDKFNSITTLEEFYSMIGEDQTDAPQDSLSELGPDLARSAIRTPPLARCEPRDTVVDIVPENSNKHSIYYPGCILVKRCSGCCLPRELKSCQPNSSSLLNYAITVSDYDIKTRSFYVRKKKEIITVEQHDTCTCQCKIKASDCNKFQIYDPLNCQCKCANIEDKEKCERNSEKIWVPQTCSCNCRFANQSDCSTGSYFNENICACSKIEDNI